MCLVHGPFGAGKSSLLVALITFLTHACASLLGAQVQARVLVVAHTNVAVDRVLIGLQVRTLTPTTTNHHKHQPPPSPPTAITHHKHQQPRLSTTSTNHNQPPPPPTAINRQ